MAFVIAHPGVTSAIIGPHTTEQLDDLLASADVTLTDDILAVMEAARRVRKLVRGSPGVELGRFGALVVVEGGLIALVVCVSRRSEPVRAAVFVGAAASLEGTRDSRVAARAGDPSPAGSPEADAG